MDNQQPQAKPSSKSGFWTIIIIVLVIATGGLFWWWVANEGTIGTDAGTNVPQNQNRQSTANNNFAPDSEDINNLSENTNANSEVTNMVKSYANNEFGFSFNIPENWNVQETSITAGSFQTSTSSSEFVISPPLNSLDFQPAGDCTLSIFEIDESWSDLSNWIADSGIYGATGSEALNIQSQNDRTFNSISGSWVVEGGPNNQTTHSFYFLKDSHVFRYGYYQDVDTSPRTMFEQFRDVCASLLPSLSMQ